MEPLDAYLEERKDNYWNLCILLNLSDLGSEMIENVTAQNVYRPLFIRVKKIRNSMMSKAGGIVSG